jgi:hypothetical protein
VQGHSPVKTCMQNRLEFFIICRGYGSTAWLM